VLRLGAFGFPVLLFGASTVFAAGPMAPSEIQATFFIGQPFTATTPSTQHFISDVRDGVDGRWVEDMFEVSTRWPRRVVEPLAVRIRSSNRAARQLNERSRETLGFETQAKRDLMLVLHRPIEPTTKSGLMH
jgi:hypothetical protein